MVVLWDLDGTLTDPFVGITTCVQTALRHFGIDVPDLRALTPHIGPPLKESFMQLHGLTAEQADEAVRVYRARFSTVGMFENAVYDGIVPLLATLRAAGVRMAVATSKPTVYSREILVHFGLADAFCEIVGSELDGRRTDKAEVIAEAMRRLRADPAETFMVGDRRFDIEGAHQNGIRAVGVGYGYAEAGELVAAGADAIVETVAELTTFLEERAKNMSVFGLKPTDILLPTGDLSRWSVVACDQYTSEPEYWRQVEALVADAPSALRVTLPEIYLQDDPAARIADINRTMAAYQANGVFRRCADAMVYIERQTSAGVRRGLLGVVDLEEYDYRSGSHAPIRATEQTVVERIPPRVAIRENAPLELPHVLLLVDDPDMTVIEPLRAATAEFEKVYDFDLMMNGGHIAGWLPNAAAITRVQEALSALVAGQDDPLLFAVGDGNHSLATAKECYRRHPSERARYALVEVVNIHDPSIQFEPIYRVLFDADPADVVASLTAALGAGEGEDAQCFTVVTATGEQQLRLRPTAKLPVGTLQAFLDEYLAAHPSVRIDYIHGADTLAALARQEGAVGFLFEGMQKSELFPAICADGSLPRKTFSMGHAADKRYYLEAREIK